MVFFGEYSVSFSAPGRIVLPKKIRELIKGSEFIISKSFNSCLAGYDKTDWELRTKELLNVSLLETENLAKRRFVFSSAIMAEIDEQGRFVLPKHMLEYANLGSKAVIIGVGDHFEIWNAERWNQEMKTMSL